VIGGRRSLQGRKPGDRRVRVDRPHSALFRWTGPGQLTAKDAAFVPPTAAGRAWSRAKALLLGRPLASEEEIGERLSKKKALAIFSSDTISSSAYATQEIIRVLATAGVAALVWSVPVAIAIAVLLAVVSTSYRQVCRAYPSGGGAYAVAKENLSQMAGLVAAAALLIDYVMTVAVSTASAVDGRTRMAMVPAAATAMTGTSRTCGKKNHSRTPRRPTSTIPWTPARTRSPHEGPQRSGGIRTLCCSPADAANAQRAAVYQVAADTLCISDDSLQGAREK